VSSLDEFVAAAPQPQRAGMRILAALGRRPRGMRALGRFAPADQLANGLIAMERFDRPAVAAALGWDAAAIVARGRELRQREGRP
jgi:hypothetical protein